MKIIATLTFGNSLNFKPPHPERTTRRDGKSFSSLIAFIQYKDRATMARKIRKHESNHGVANPCPVNLQPGYPIVPLKETEGY